MYKLTTQLAFFRFNTINNYGTLTVTWYALEQDNEGDDEGRCFTKQELDDFTQFAVSHPINLPGNKNYFNCTDEEAPSCGFYSIVPNENLNFPKKLILRKIPQLESSGDIYDCMDIILTNQSGTDNHTYNLNFDIIGKIEI